ncbi:M48 family metalloprotease (plasmid) [Tundrisphaera sp. TA3]|uniref:M48 family metalloprotease n=1 Tax=Tundrisphaera sp. TA3 TaxID=3435775 RepID=UPI003EB8B2C2
MGWTGFYGAEVGMGIVVACPICRASFRADEAHLGKRAKCPKCREVIRVGGGSVPDGPAPPAPAAEPEEETYGLDVAPKVGGLARKAVAARIGKREAAEAAPTRPTRNPTEILAAFRGEIRPVRPTLMYRLWVILVAAIMVILPLVYLALIGLVGYGLFLYAMQGPAFFRGVRVNKLTLAIYVGPLVCGVIVLGFMLKPLFARPVRREKTRELDPSKEPLLAAFVDGVCASVGAPRPARIDVDCQVNASAHLASRALSPSKRLVLTIGLPLVAGLTLKQFTGVLAHEFGHFSQGTGMRLTILIRSINAWFARVVYERDDWDQMLEDGSREGHVAIILVAGLSRMAVWLTRRILWVLMYVGHLASGFLLRQMEYDADRYEARMVGGPVFAETMDRISELNVASAAAHHELSSYWSERRLPDDLPRLIRIEAAKMPEPLRRQIREAASSRKPSLFDTHPTNPARIARALTEADRGIFALDGPATDLFRDFDDLARKATFDYYRAQLGRDVGKDQLFPIADALLDQEVRREGDEAFDRFFLGALGPNQALPLPAEPARAPSDPRESKRELIAARKAQSAARASNLAALGRWAEIQGRAIPAEAASTLTRAGKAIAASDYGLDRATTRAADAAREKAEADAGEIVAQSAPFGESAASRLALAIGFLEMDAVVARVAGGEALRDEARVLLPCASALGGRIMPALPPVSRAVAALEHVVGRYQAGDQEDREAINAVLRGGEALHGRLTELKWKLGDAIPYPFEHAREDTTLGRFALPAVPDAKDIGDLLRAGAEAQDRLFTLHRRVLGRLATIAEAVEKALGLAPIPLPEA